MSGTYQLVGGPFDGKIISLRRRLDYLWVEPRFGEFGQVTRCVCFTTPGSKRELYRRSLWREGLARTRDAYAYAGHTYALCPGCGAFVDRLDGHVIDCSLCGSALAEQPSSP